MAMSSVVPNSDDEIRVLHNISSFENININSNVTFYEKTLGNDKKIKGLTVTSASEIKINAGGVLTLRIDPTNTGSEDKIIGHALYGNIGTIKSEGGKLLLALNGAGNEEIINFGGTTLNESLVTQDKTKNKADITFDTTSKFHTIERVENINNEVKIVLRRNLPDYLKYTQLNKIYQSIASVEDLIGNFNVDDDAKLSTDAIL